MSDNKQPEPVPILVRLHVFIQFPIAQDPLPIISAKDQLNDPPKNSTL
jgi:hypothetical protein